MTALSAAGFGALIGVIVAKVWDTLQARRTRSRHLEVELATAEIVDGTQLRQELWRELDELRDRLDRVQDELDRSRRENLRLLAEHTTLKAEHQVLRRDHETLLAKYAELEAQLAGA